MIIKWPNHCDYHRSPDPLANLVDQVRPLSASGGFHQMGFLTKRCPHCVIDCKFFWVLLTKSSCIYDILYYFRLLTKRCPHVNVIYHIIFGIWPRDILMTYVYIIDYMGLLPPRSVRKTIYWWMMLSKSWTCCWCLFMSLSKIFTKWTQLWETRNTVIVASELPLASIILPSTSACSLSIIWRAIQHNYHHHQFNIIIPILVQLVHYR